MFHKKTIHDIELSGKTVLLRAELDSPLSADGHKVVSDFRLQSNIPTIQALLEKNCKIVIVGKLGRPGGKPDSKLSARPVAAKLQAILDHPVRFVDDCFGEKVKAASAKLEPGQILMLENLYFYAEDGPGDEKLAHLLVEDSGADVFVQDCFASAHRSEIIVGPIPKFLPSVAGLSIEKEVSTITEAMEHPKRPLMALMGGAKISDKIQMLERFIDIADIVAVGGALANTLLLADGIDVGKSKVEKEALGVAKEVLERARTKAKKGSFVFYIPQDGVVATTLDSAAKTRLVDWQTHVIADVQAYPKTPPHEASVVHKEEMILDVGPFSTAFIAGCMQLAHTVIWNGTMGVTETKGLNSATGPFAHSTEYLVEAMLGQFGNRPYTLVGGGDTVGYLQEQGLADKFDHVSTGGGASMDLMSGKKLPAVEALEDK
jgi:phosphoglycerate kinase